MNRRARLGSVIAAVLLAAAAPAGGQASRPAVTLPGYRGMVFLDTVGVVREFDAPAATVTRALEAAFTDLGIAVDVDAARGLVGNLQIKTQRKFAGARMSQLLDCGYRDRGPNADFYRIHLALMGMVTPLSATRSSLRVAFAAGAQDFSGPLADPVACGSSGKLEAQVLDSVATRIR